MVNSVTQTFGNIFFLIPKWFKCAAKVWELGDSENGSPGMYEQAQNGELTLPPPKIDAECQKCSLLT